MPHSPCDVCTPARMWICTPFFFVLNQKATQRSQRMHSLNLTIWVKGEEEKRDSGENNLGGGSTNFQGLFMTHAEKKHVVHPPKLRHPLASLQILQHFIVSRQQQCTTAIFQRPREWTRCARARLRLISW